jgi:calcineurin-like phosphoesterase family protein
MSNTWFTSDLHLGHDKNQKGFGGIIMHANRPFATIEEHDEYLISRWNTVVQKDDDVWILGDFAWRNHNKYVARLKGKKYLILGSHDKMTQINKAQFSEVHVGMAIRNFPSATMPFILTHCAMRVWERSHYGSINLYGHSHGRLVEYPYSCQMDVGVDVSDNYTPFPLEFILYKMSLKHSDDSTRPSEEELRQRVQENRDNNIKLLDEWRRHASLIR